MSQAINSSKSLVGGGLVLQPNSKSRVCEHVSPYTFTLDPGKAGTVSTKSDANTGELTLGTGHGITDGMIVDVHWRIAGVNYCQRKCTVGTVATNVVPIDNGVGDNLPASPQAIVCSVHSTQLVTAHASSLQVLGLLAKELTGVAVEGVQVQFYIGAGTVPYAPLLKLDDLVQADVVAGEANPLGTTDIVSVTMTNGSATLSVELSILIGENV